MQPWWMSLLHSRSTDAMAKKPFLGGCTNPMWPKWMWALKVGCKAKWLTVVSEEWSTMVLVYPWLRHTNSASFLVIMNQQWPSLSPSHKNICFYPWSTINSALRGQLSSIDDQFSLNYWYWTIAQQSHYRFLWWFSTHDGLLPKSYHWAILSITGWWFDWHSLPRWLVDEHIFQSGASTNQIILDHVWPLLSIITHIIFHKLWAYYYL